MITLVSSPFSRAAALLVAFACAASADVIPPERLIPGGWKPGIPGGIPTNLTVFCNVKNAPYNAKGDGVTDDQPAIQQAMSACPQGQVVFIPEGTYRLNNNLGVQHKGIVLRGAGPDKTKLICYSTNGPIIIMNTYSPWDGGFAITSIAQGSNTLTLKDTQRAGATASDWIPLYSQYGFIVQTPNDPSFVEGTPAYMGDTVAQFVKITGASGWNITVDRPVYFDYQHKDQYQMKFLLVQNLQSGQHCTDCGVEDLYVERAVRGGSHNIQYINAQNSWVKNVESYNANNWHIRLEGCFRSEVRDCYIHHGWNGGGDTIYGVGLFNRSTDCLTENNIFDHCRHSLIIEYGGMGNVFGYNYSVNTINESQDATDFLMADMITHGGQPSYNLWEGNIVARLSFDDVLGGSYRNTAFRNWIWRKSIPSVQNNLRAAEVMRNNLQANIVGNLMCTEGQTATAYTWAPNVYSSIRRLGYSADGENYHEGVDPRVAQTLIYHLNWDYVYKTTFLDPNIPDTSIPKSYYLAQKPEYFGNLRFPAFGPDLTPMRGLIPAQVRWDAMHGIQHTPPPGTTGLRATSAPSAP